MIFEFTAPVRARVKEKRAVRAKRRGYTVVKGALAEQEEIRVKIKYFLLLNSFFVGITLLYVTTIGHTK